MQDKEQTILKLKGVNDAIIKSRDSEIKEKEGIIAGLQIQIIELNRRIAELVAEIKEMKPETAGMKRKKEKILKEFEDLMYVTFSQRLFQQHIHNFS